MALPAGVPSVTAPPPLSFFLSFFLSFLPLLTEPHVPSTINPSHPVPTQTHAIRGAAALPATVNAWADYLPSLTTPFQTLTLLLALPLQLVLLQGGAAMPAGVSVWGDALPHLPTPPQTLITTLVLHP